MRSPFVPDNYLSISEAKAIFFKDTKFTNGDFTKATGLFWFSQEYFHFGLHKDILPLVKEYSQEVGIDNVTRSGFYRFFFDRLQLGASEYKKLQKFALYFENKQTDTLEKVTFKKLLAEQNFSTVTIQWLKKSNLIYSDEPDGPRKL